MRRPILRNSITDPRTIKLLLAILTLLVTIMVSESGMCRKVRQKHIVKAGDSVAKIADFYGVSQRDLRELNGLREGRPLKIGQKLDIPAVLRVSGKKYRVKQGDTLASVGKKFKRSAKQIAHANKLKMGAALVVGRTLVIPDNDRTDTNIKIKGDAPKPILFLRVVNGERERLQLYTRQGKIIHRSVQRLSYLARDKRGDHKSKRMHFRLVHMLQQVANKFPGKAIEIISGYRPQSEGNESQHAFGRALDFRVSGVSTGALFRFCKSLPRVGCGYYPNSGFVHMDAREKKTFWVDRSGAKK